MNTYLREIDDVRSIGQAERYIEVRVEIARMGIPLIRSIYAYVSPFNNIAMTWIRSIEIVDAYKWLNEAFDIEFVQSSATILSGARELGLKFISQAEVDDVTKYFFDMNKKLEIAQQHLLLNTTNVPVISEDHYSAFTEALDSLNFDQPIEGE